MQTAKFQFCAHRLAVALVALLGLFAAASNAARAQEGSSWANEAFATSGAKDSGASNSDKPRRALRAITARPSQPKPQATADAGGGNGNARGFEPSRGSLSGGGITWQASSGCVPGQLRGVLNDLAGTFGPVTVTSTCRGRSQNRAAGGAGQSYHLSGEAVDFRVHGSIGAVYAHLSASGSVGGLKHYGGGLFHIDTGPRRSW